HAGRVHHQAPQRGAGPAAQPPSRAAGAGRGSRDAGVREGPRQALPDGGRLRGGAARRSPARGRGAEPGGGPDAAPAVAAGARARRWRGRPSAARTTQVGLATAPAAPSEPTPIREALTLPAGAVAPPMPLPAVTPPTVPPSPMPRPAPTPGVTPPTVPPSAP